MSSLAELGGSLNQGDSERGNSDYYPCEIRGSNGTRIRIPSGMRQGFGDKREKENGHVSFTERNGMRSKWVNRMKERESGEFGPKEIVLARSRGCTIRDIVNAGVVNVVVASETPQASTRSNPGIHSSPLLLQTRRATGDIRQPRRLWPYVGTSGANLIPESTGPGDVPIPGTTGPSMSTGTRGRSG